MTLDLDKLPGIRNLSDDVRKKALEFADALGARGPRPTTVLGTAVTLAQEWKSGRLPTKQGGPAVLVQPRNGRWIIRRADSEHATHTFLGREDAVRRAQDLARRYATACLVFGPGGTLIERYGAPGASAPVPVPDAVVAPVEPEVIIEAALAPEPPFVAALPVAAREPEIAAVVAALEPEVVAVVEAELAPVVAAEPELVSEVVAPEPEPELAPEPEPIFAVTDLDVPPLRVKKLGQKWAVVRADGRTETFGTKLKAHKRAKDLAASLGCAVVFA